MPAPTAAAARLSARTRQPGHDRSWKSSERSVADLLRVLLPDGFEVVEQPRDLADLYSSDPQAGLVPELKVTCVRTGRFCFVEVKRQGSRGNAEERVYKLFTGPFIAAVAARTGLPYHPFVAVFCDELATDRRYEVRFAVHLEPGSYLRWAGRDPMLFAAFVDDLRDRWLEPAELGPSPHPRCVAVAAGLEPASVADPLRLF